MGDGCFRLLPEKYPNLACARDPIPPVAGGNFLK
ncbi:hypothetical protein R2APBS1_3048 [Rhodanobacter denitrificans]|uniref:Uncharacterized protein n=1 Tax=Rhodanobacter denitrificans TaxID=666685 RepID=M4NRD5_9GAMM|nr:hypothetical protein R2APBS1_3048 [Rhodanobacter denitrificans]